MLQAASNRDGKYMGFAQGPQAAAPSPSGTRLGITQLQIGALANLGSQSRHIAVACGIVQRERHGWARDVRSWMLAAAAQEAALCLWRLPGDGVLRRCWIGMSSASMTRCAAEQPGSEQPVLALRRRHAKSGQRAWIVKIATRRQRAGGASPPSSA